MMPYWVPFEFQGLVQGGRDLIAKLFRVSIALCLLLPVLTSTIMVTTTLGAPSSGPVWASGGSELLGRDDAMSIWGSAAYGGAGTGIGASLAGGDLDGDGREDIIVGAPGSTIGVGGGVVMVFFARDPSEMHTLSAERDADLIIMGRDTNDKFGSIVQTYDLDADGLDELVISAPYADGLGNAKRDSGEVYIVQGQPRASFGSRRDLVNISLLGHIYGRDPGDHLGSYLRTGDLDADSVPDLIVCSEGSGGKIEAISEFENEALGSWEIEVIKGSTSGLGELDLTITGSMVRFYGSYVGASGYAQHIGNGLALGDFDGDGTDDMAFSYRFSDTGRVCLYKGGTSFPGVAPGTTITVEASSGFTPNMRLSLGSDGLTEAKLSLGDIDGDSRLDLAVGMPFAPGWDPERYYSGQVDVYLGRPLSTPLSIGRSSARTTLFGEDSSDNVGRVLCPWDHDGDGRAELVITVPGSDGMYNLLPDSGEGIVLDQGSLSQRNINATYMSRHILGPSIFSYAFTAVSTVDINGDGKEELLVSSPGAKMGTDSLGLTSLLMEGKVMDGQFIGGSPISKFGHDSLMEDFDGDGYLDVVIASPFSGSLGQGQTFLFFGGPEGWSGKHYASSDADLVYEDAPEGSELGSRLASGDLNDDGRPDLIIGEAMYYIQDGSYPPTFHPDGGLVSIYWGGSRSYMAGKPHKEIWGYLVERAGRSLTIGDLNGDNIDDLAFGGPYDVGDHGLGRYHAGVVYIFFGPISSTREVSAQCDVKVVGAQDNDLLGESLSSGDISGDGIDDLILGAPRADPGSVTDQGAVYVLKGRSSWPSVMDLRSSYDLRAMGSWPYDKLGASLASGDVDLDGYSELFMGTPNADGYERSYLDGGTLFVLMGSTLSVSLDGRTLTMRNDVDITVHGDQEGQNIGSDIDIGDLDGDGRPEVFIGSPGWTDPSSQLMTGCIHVLTKAMFDKGLVINSTSLPRISGLPGGAMGGGSVYCADATGDGRVDLLIGAPGDDPFGTTENHGSTYYWEGKDLTYRNPRAGPLAVSSDHSVLSDGLSVPVLAAKEGPYVLTVPAMDDDGAESITTVSVELFSDSGPGSSVLRYDAVQGRFEMTSTGVFSNTGTLDPTLSKASSDGFQTLMVDFGVTFDWKLPRVDLVLTRVQSASGMHVNYFNQEFLLDANISIHDGPRVLDRNGPYTGGWLNASSEISITNLSLVHSLSGMPLSSVASEGILLGLYDPSGRPLGAFEPSDGSSYLSWTDLGDNLDGTALPFYIGPAALPTKAAWNGNLTIPLAVDTYPPPGIGSFKVIPDGREKGEGTMDDDRTVEIWFDMIKDIGSSGIAQYLLEVRNMGGVLERTPSPVQPGDMIVMDEGQVNITLYAVDNAGNRGPPESRTLLVDITGPSFSDPTPPADKWLNEGNLKLSVKVQDTGSGIDATSFRYRVYRGDAGILTDWSRVTSYHQVPGGYVLNATPVRFQSSSNYVQWSAMDGTGTESVSQPYPFNSDMTPPIIRPMDKGPMLRPSGPFEVKCQIEDLLSGLDLRTLEYRSSSSGSIYSASWANADQTGSAKVVVHSMLLNPDYIGSGYLQWRVSDNAGNSIESPLISIFVDGELPSFRSFEPNGTEPLVKRNVQVAAYIYDGGTGLGQSDVEVSVSTISGWVANGVGGFTPWARAETVEDLGLGTFKASSTVLFDEGPFNLVRFRARDGAGNGWVISGTVRFEVTVPALDLPPVALFRTIPVGDLIQAGEGLMLDGSASYDPEGRNLTYEWYSDIEGFPLVGRLGTGPVLNISLSTIGVHSIYLVVSDGSHRTESERTKVKVTAPTGEGGEEGGQESIWDILRDSLLLILVALLFGLLIGGVIVAVVLRKDEERPVPLEATPVRGVQDQSEGVPICPYCDGEVRLSDEYCMKCGSVFTAEDKEKMISGKGKKHSEKLGKGGIGGAGLPPLEEGSDDDGPSEPAMEAEEDWGDEDVLGHVPGPVDDLDMDEDVEESIEELEELDTVPDMDDEDLEWGVRN